MSLVAIIVGLVGWINQSFIAGQWRWYTIQRPFLAANVWPFVLGRMPNGAQAKGYFQGMRSRPRKGLLPGDGRGARWILCDGVAAERGGQP